MEFKAVKYDIDISEVDPFKNCKLGRKAFAENLTSLLKNSSDTSLTLALDGAWGMGKTTFLQMFKQHLILNNIPTIYFSAWESDYTNEPLLAIIAEFDKQLSEQTSALQDRGLKTKIKNRMIKASTMVVPAIGKGIASIVLKQLGIDSIVGEAVKEVLDDTKNWGKELLKAYEESTKNIQNFKKNLREVLELLGERKPIVIIIDELDRCKPLYSIQVLEIVKHFFDIEGITFILSADYTQLKESIKHCYGAGFDADTYTHKFFDFYFTLDIKNSPDDLVKSIFEKQWESQSLESGLDFHVNFILDAMKSIDLSIRDIQQVANTCSLIYKSFDEELYKDLSYFIVYYIIEKHKNGEFYKQLSEIQIFKSVYSSVSVKRISEISQSIRLQEFRQHVKYYICFLLSNDEDLLTFRPNDDSEFIWNSIQSVFNSISHDRRFVHFKYMNILSFLDYIQ